MSTTAPTAYALERVVGDAMRTLETLRTEHGLVLDSEEDVLTALAEEGVDVGTIIKALTRAALDSKAMGAAADLRIADLKQRRERFARHEQTYRATVQQVLEALALKKFAAEDFSLSLSAGQSKVVIVDEAALPEMMMKVTITRAPDKAMIKGALDAGIEVAGASMSNGAAVLTVRSR